MAVETCTAMGITTVMRWRSCTAPSRQQGVRWWGRGQQKATNTASQRWVSTGEGAGARTWARAQGEEGGCQWWVLTTDRKASGLPAQTAQVTWVHCDAAVTRVCTRNACVTFPYPLPSCSLQDPDPASFPPCHLPPQAEIEPGTFCGLALDEDNQGDLTDGRVAAWTAQVLAEMKAKAAAA